MEMGIESDSTFFLSPDYRESLLLYLCSFHLPISFIPTCMFKTETLSLLLLMRWSPVWCGIGLIEVGKAE